MQKLDRQPSNRRHFLSQGALSLSGVALAWLAQQTPAAAAPPKPDLSTPEYNTLAKQPMHAARAKAVISLWMQGGPSHIDLFDPKPALHKLDGQSFPGKIKYDNAAQASAKVLASPWRFSNHGACGMELSELVPHMGSIADDICLIRSMRTGVNNHGQSIRALNTGRIQEGQPSLGSWVTYGLGSETQDLPAYMSLIDPGQLPVLGVENWSNGWLPAIYQGTVVRAQEPRILNLAAPEKYAGQVQAGYLDFLNTLNHRHLEQHPGELDLSARIASFELAARMQVAAKEALDLSGETAATKRMYGLENKATAEYGTRCLIARRLIERGVRFVQVFTQNQFWDHHGSIRSKLPASCQKVDQPSAALVKDLKQRGLLDSTVVQWGGEMGRLPVVQNDAGPRKIGRDHNTYGFSMWVAGGGFRGGCTYGNTDEFGHEAVEDVVNHYDYHHTLLHLLGVDQAALSFQQNQRERKLIENVESRIVSDII